MKFTMKQYFIISFLILTLSQVNGQSLSSARTDVYKMYVPKYGKPEKIIEENTFYGSEITRNKNIFEFSEKLDTIKVSRFKNSELEAELIFIFNSKHQLVFQIFRNNVPLVGWQHEQSTYSYNENGLSEVKTTDASGNLRFLAKIECDSSGNPIRLELFDSKLNLFGYETGDYDYSRNKWIYCVFDRNRNKVSEEELNIEGVMPADSKYNENGDCILYRGNRNNKDDIYYQKEYKYDVNGNWTEINYYKCQMVDGELKNKKVDRKFKRKIIYQK